MSNFNEENRALSYYPQDLNTSKHLSNNDNGNNQANQTLNNSLLSSIFGNTNISGLFNNNTISSLFANKVLGENGQQNNMALSMLNNLFTKSEKNSHKEMILSENLFEEL